MIDTRTLAAVMAGYLLLFFSVHGYMDIRMFRSKRTKRTNIVTNEFIIPLWAKFLALTPSLVFWVVFLASPFFLYFGFSEEIPFILRRTAYEDYFQVGGLILMLAAIILADWGRVSRGLTAPSGPMPEGYTLTTKGAYGVVRHPMYASYSLFFVGLPLVFLSWPLFFCVLGIPGYYLIARAEERILIRRFGEQYRNYQKKVGMFIPR